MRWFKILFVLCLMVSTQSFLTGCGSSSSNGSDDSDDDGDADVATVTLSGEIAVSDTDASLIVPPALRAATKSIRPSFSTVATAVLPDVEVALVQIEADGTETEVATTTSDATGNYSFSDVPVAVGGTGADSDYYYEVVVSDDDVDVRAPVAPTGDASEETVNVSPESTVAARLISDVVTVPGETTNPVPGPEIFEDVTALVESNIEDIEASITIPSNSSDSTDTMVDFANGIAAAGGDAEVIFKAFQFESEFVALTSDEETTTDELTGYVERVAREICDQSSTNIIPNITAEVLATEIEEGTTYTPAEIITAYNELTNEDLTVATEVTEFAEILDEVETGTDDVEALVKAVEVIGDDNLVGALTMRDLDAAALSESSVLDPDQALAFFETLGPSPCSVAGVDISDFVAELTASSALSSPAIGEVEIYHNSGFGCNNGDNELHFEANVSVYIPSSSSVTATSVTVQSSDTDALDTDPDDGAGTGRVNLAADPGGIVWSGSDTEGDPDCVEINEEVTYTVTVTFSDSTTDTMEVTRNHPSVPEADVTFGATALSETSASPTVVTDARPLLTWEDPATVLAEMTGAPTDSAIKYTYEYAHFRAGDSGPINSDSSPDCPSVSDGKLYAVDNFLPTVDCQVDDCATAQGTTPDQISCRINVQTYLVDSSDNLLGQAAGEFKFLCVDTNADGDCGN